MAQQSDLREGFENRSQMDVENPPRIDLTWRFGGGGGGGGGGGKELIVFFTRTSNERSK